MTKATAGATRATMVLTHVRRLFTDRVLDGAALRELGVDFNHGGSLPLGDHRLLGVIREAGRAPDCGAAPIDVKIRAFLDGAYGWGRWEQDRPLYPWERPSSDPELENVLFPAQDVADAEHAQLMATMWSKKDALAACYRLDSSGRGTTATQAASDGEIRKLTTELDATIKALERAREAQQLARGRVLARQLHLQRVFRDKLVAR
jgi:hypothetical protein